MSIQSFQEIYKLFAVVMISRSSRPEMDLKGNKSCMQSKVDLKVEIWKVLMSIWSPEALPKDKWSSSASEVPSGRIEVGLRT